MRGSQPRPAGDTDKIAFIAFVKFSPARGPVAQLFLEVANSMISWYPFQDVSQQPRRYRTAGARDRATGAGARADPRATGTSLANAQSVLNSLFDGSDGANPDGSVSSGESVASTTTAAGKRAKSPRRAEVIAYLEEHGPTKRARLIEATGIPEGTISYLLNDKSRFRRLEDGTWDMKPDDDAGLPLD